MEKVPDPCHPRNRLAALAQEHPALAAALASLGEAITTRALVGASERIGWREAGIPRRRFNELCRAGAFGPDARRVGATWLAQRAEIEAWILEHGKKPRRTRPATATPRPANDASAPVDDLEAEKVALRRQCGLVPAPRPMRAPRAGGGR